jgi:hypothetical protein
MMHPLPESLWGQTHFGAWIEFAGTGETTFVVTAGRAGAALRTEPATSANGTTLGGYQSIEFSATEAFVLESDEPVQLVQFLPSTDFGVVPECVSDPTLELVCSSRWQCENRLDFAEPGASLLSDPESLVHLPSRHWADRYLVWMPEDDCLSRLAVLVREGESLSLNGVPIVADGSLAAITAVGAGWVQWDIVAEAGVQLVEGSADFALIVHHHSHYESSAYAAGDGLLRRPWELP